MLLLLMLCLNKVEDGGGFCAWPVTRHGQRRGQRYGGHDGRLQVLVDVDTECQGQGSSGLSGEERQVDLHVFSCSEAA